MKRSNVPNKHNPEKSMEKMIASGCNGYIEKPIDPEKVMNQIREIIGEKS